MVDPRHVGLANKADIWLRVRPGTDGALALGIANVMIERGWYDREFIRDWTNGPLLGALRHRPAADRTRPRAGRRARRGLVAWNEAAAGRSPTIRAIGRYEGDDSRAWRSTANIAIATTDGEVVCQPGVRSLRRGCAANIRRRWSRRSAGYRPRQVEEAARMIWEARPVSYYAWSGHEQHANATQIARAMSLLYALTGSFDAPGGNVLFPAVPTAPITGEELPAAQAAGARPRPR